MIQSCLFQKSTTKFSESNALSQLFQANALVFLLTSVITALREFYAPIDCLYDGMQELQKSYVDSYCWGNYENIILPQSQPMRMMSAPDARSNFQVKSPVISGLIQKKHGNYYRWIPLIFLFQAMLAYLPTWIWRNLLRDRRLYETISSIKDSTKAHSRRKLLIINLANDLFSEGIQRRYAKPFFFCEVLNLVSLLLNVLITNFVLHNEFLLYGPNVLGMRLRSRTMSMMMDQDFTSSTSSDLFPTFAKCSVKLVKKAAPPGTLQIKKEEAFCMISFNSLCESIFMFFWAWFCILIISSLCGIIYRLFLLARRKRKKLLMQVVDKSFDEKLSQICEKLGFYSWFVLYRISRNVDPLTFQDIISSLMVRLDSGSATLQKTIKDSPKDGSQIQHTSSTTSTTATLGKSRTLATIV